jgi:hypothetical protein
MPWKRATKAGNEEKRQSLWLCIWPDEEARPGRPSVLRYEAAAGCEVHPEAPAVHDAPANQAEMLQLDAASNLGEGPPRAGRNSIEEDEMRNLYTTERLFEDLFGVRREFDEMFNRILVGNPGGWNCLNSRRPLAFTQR